MDMLYWGRGLKEFQTSVLAHCHGDLRLEGILEVLSLDALRVAIASYRAEGCLVVLAPGAEAELEPLVTLGSLLAGMPVILLLPSGDRRTLAMAHRLHPRFCAVFEEDLTTAAAVAVRIIRNWTETQSGVRA